MSSTAPLYYRYWVEEQPHGFIVGGVTSLETTASTFPYDTHWNMLLAFLFLGFLFGLFAYVLEIPHTERKRITAVPPIARQLLGSQTTREMLMENSEFLVPPSHPLHRHLTAVGNRISDANGLPRNQYVLIDQPTVNAFVLPGNTVFVFTGLLPLLDDDDGAAMVLAHELSHVVAGHTTDTLPLKTLIYVFLAVTFGGIGEMAFNVGYELPFSRSSEYEADQIGLHLLAKACFDVPNAVTLFERMSSAQEEGDTPFEFMSTHPNWETRLSTLKELAESDSVNSLLDLCEVQPGSRRPKHNQKDGGGGGFFASLASAFLGDGGVTMRRSSTYFRTYPYYRGFPHLEGEELSRYVEFIEKKATVEQ